ncbi:Hydroxysteroid dehydrogenase-like protein 2, variant 2 [Chamberlinius hualienensis]
MAEKKLAGRTVFITGASRGIGKAIALKLAKDGANIVIAAKTAQAHPTLPGTIYTAAKEVEAAGGKCLPCVVDIRNEEQIQSAIESAVKQFGGLDILVNNASAISLTSTLDTTMKRYDLMHGINARGTYVTSKLCIPYLKQGKNPHILNISPPLNMKPIWFKNHVAYTMAKYGMSMCVLGMAEEFKGDNIAVNAIWPKTAIATAAMEFLGGKGAIKQCRTEEIMADAAYLVLTKDCRNFTGNFCIDEQLLREVGVDNFDKYAVEPGHPLLPDFFLDEAEGEADNALFKKAKKEAKMAASSSTASDSQGGAGGQVPKIFDGMKALLSEEMVAKTAASYSFVLTGPEEGKWYLDLKTGGGSVGQGDPPAAADVTFTMKDEDFIKMIKGQLKATTAFMSGKLKLKGDMGKAMKLEKIMTALKSHL